MAKVSDELSRELLDLYRQLGGTAAHPDFRPGAWDLSFEDGLVVELDEELHFNRYRGVTLASSWSMGQAWAADYAGYCANHEQECLRAGRWGKRWTNASTARMFSGGSAGDLEAGAPRWKQRALYDSIKDLGPVVLGDLRLARISVYDEIEGVQLGTILEGTARLDPAHVRRHLERRTT